MKLVFGSDHANVLNIVVNHDLVNPKLLVYPGEHDLLIYRLIFSSNVIVIEVNIQIVHVLNERKRVKNIDIIYIEGVLGELKTALSEELCPVDSGMHEKIMSLGSSLNVLPGKHLLNGEHCVVAHYLVALLPHLVVYEVAYKKIQLLLAACKV